MKNAKKLRLSIIIFFYTINSLLAGTPIKHLENLKSITFYERTGALLVHTFDVNSYELNNRYTNHMNSFYNDFEGWVGEEFYDVFYSDSDGKFNVNGEFISIEASFHNTGGGGGLNIAEIAFNFTNGNYIFGSYIASYQALGSTYMPGSELFAADCDLSNGSRMGYTTSSNPIKLRITIGFTKREKFINYVGCQNDGFSITVNGNTYNVDNPTGTEIIKTNGGCDSIVYINLDFGLVKIDSFKYIGCQGDNYFIIVNGNIYNEQNPFGIELMQTIEGCDSSIQINLFFLDSYRKDIVYDGCKNDGFSIMINNVEYNEIHSQGTEIVHSSTGCDTIFKIDLTFHATDSVYINYDGCINDGYSIKIGKNIYNEANTKGKETLINQFSCDSIILIDLKYKDCEKIYEEKCKIEIPNIFSPNNDGKNDNFFVRINDECEFKDFNVYIFDRWGNLVYFSDKLDFKWNGKKGENPVVSGVYTYFVTYKTKYSQIKKLSGDVTLLK
jgi:gliding motility-associated-like protein